MNHRPVLATLWFAAIFMCAQPATVNSNTFRTNARFSKDSENLHFSTAVALVEAPKGNFTRMDLNFYTFPLAASEVTSVMQGSLAPLERKRQELARNARERNLSSARIGIILTPDREVWNASLGFPGISCTIVVSKEDTSKAFQEFRFDGRQLLIRGKGVQVCDLTRIGMGKSNLGWDIDVNVPVFDKK